MFTLRPKLILGISCGPQTTRLALKRPVLLRRGQRPLSDASCVFSGYFVETGVACVCGRLQSSAPGSLTNALPRGFVGSQKRDPNNPCAHGRCARSSPLLWRARGDPGWDLWISHANMGKSSALKLMGVQRIVFRRRWFQPWIAGLDCLLQLCFASPGVAY